MHFRGYGGFIFILILIQLENLMFEEDANLLGRRTISSKQLKQSPSHELSLGNFAKHVAGILTAYSMVQQIWGLRN